VAGVEPGLLQTEPTQGRDAGGPPFGRLAGIILSGPDLSQLFALGNALARQDHPLRQINAQVFGPAPAPIARVRGRHRVRLLVKAGKTAALQPALATWIGQFKLKAQMRLAVDIDPQSFY
jgi:primosomal protein N' (replication factor Y)